MSAPLKVPVGDAPGWETKTADDAITLNSVFESSALHHSVRQSRSTWLTSVFPKFTSKSRAKGQRDMLPPPHNLRYIAKCDIEIGPHIFADTSVYEAHYLSEPSPYATGFPATYTAPYSQTTSGSYSYPLTSYSPYVGPAASSNSPAATPVSGAETRDPSLDVTPALIAQVNEAAATNPTLHNLLQTAAAGEATMDQLRTLGFFIQQLATAQQQAPARMPTTNLLGAQAANPPSAFMQAANYSPPHIIPKNPDLVLEFRENHMDRFLVPREIVACEQEVPPSQTFRKDIVLYTFVPFVNDEAKFKSGRADRSRTPTIIRLLNVTEAIWEVVRSWVNEEAKSTNAWDSFYDKAEASGPRAYLQYRLPSGDLLSQLRTACDTGYTMKSIKPTSTSEATGSKRNRPRRVAPRTDAKDMTKNPEAQANLPLGTQDSELVNEAGPNQRKSLPKAGSKPNPRARNGIFFINTIAPPPAPHLDPGPPPAPAPASIPGPSTDGSAPPPLLQGNV